MPSGKLDAAGFRRLHGLAGDRIEASLLSPRPVDVDPSAVTGRDLMAIFVRLSAADQRRVVEYAKGLEPAPGAS